MFIKKMLSTIALFVAIFPIASFAGGPLDDGLNECGVPVCNVQETLSALEALNEDGRYNFSNKLLATYKDSQDESVLKNLLTVSKEIKTLSLDSGDADWVVREASSLKDSMVMGLAKYSQTDSDTMIAYFKELTSAQKRYEIIAYWIGALETIEDIKTLEKLVSFSQGAMNYSLEMGDEAWIPREAGNLISKITIKLTHLDPAHEGLYTVSITEGDMTGVLPFNKIAVLDSSSSENLMVVFFNSHYKKTSFSYSSTALAGNTITGKSLSNTDTSSVFEIKLDRSTGSVIGMIETTDTKIKFTGTQNFSTRTVFAGTVPYNLTENDVIGEFEGSLAGLAGRLTVKSFTANIYSATFRTNTGSVKMDFLGKFFIKNGVLSLTSKNQVKLTLSLRENEKGDVAWKGFSFSTKNTSFAAAEFKVLQ